MRLRRAPHAIERSEISAERVPSLLETLRRASTDAAFQLAFELAGRSKGIVCGAKIGAPGSSPFV